MARLCPVHLQHAWPISSMARKVVTSALKDRTAVSLILPLFQAFTMDAGSKSTEVRVAELSARLEEYAALAMGTGSTTVGRALGHPKHSPRDSDASSDGGSRGGGTGARRQSPLAPRDPDPIRASMAAAPGSMSPMAARRMVGGRFGPLHTPSGTVVLSYPTMRGVAEALVRTANGEGPPAAGMVGAMGGDSDDSGGVANTAGAAAGAADAGVGAATIGAGAGAPDGSRRDAAAPQEALPPPETRVCFTKFGVEPASKHEGLAAKRSIEWGRFPDGWPNISLDRVKDVRYNTVALLLDLRHPQALFEQLCVLYSLPQYGALRLRVVVPYFPGQSDRISHSGEVATAWVLARLLSQLPPCGSGPAQLIVLDIHALQERHFFLDQVQVRPRSCVGLVRERLLRSPDAADIAIAWPDDGAAKRFSSHFHRCGHAIFPLVICHKRREGDKRVVHIAEGDPAGKVVCIVDDLVQSGGTLLQCAEALLAAGAVRVMAYVTHAVFPDESWRRFTASDCPIDRFFITDTIPEMADQLRGVAPFEVLSIAPVLADLLGLDDHLVPECG
ncbi:hypothetical protein FNF28_05431 [Cafeteria roenbergensis]|uniref:Phosphoribosyltransferase domain-containing protein n=2 Tax=Cafeteria roenbergensis TaxID=33653 RepID=A0A5A8D5K5_CAFRO|nr:hypothetical protein FNF28_05431 [Cafeteria roenbergensis]